jgi:hypothetical protein
MIIPETWENTESFANWYVTNNTPFLPPAGTEVFMSDDATAFCMFRKGQFQVELYLVHPQPNVPNHEHPGVEVVEVAVMDTVVNLVPVLKNGQAHGSGIREKANVAGYPLISVQRWHPKLTPTTVAAQWKGKTAGPMHSALIKRFHPDAYVTDEYADVTRKMTDVEYC